MKEVSASALKAIPRNVWVLGLAALFTDMSTEMIHSILPLFLTVSLHCSASIVGIIEGLAESAASLLKVFSGALSDYLGRRKLLVTLGYGLSALVKPIFALAPVAGWVLVARAGDRIGKGIRGAPRDALLADSTSNENRGAAFGLRQSLDTVGAFLGPATAAAVLYFKENDFRLVFWCATLPGVLSVLLLMLGLKEPQQQRTLANKSPIIWSSLRSMGTRFWLLVIALLLFNLGNSSDAFLLLKAHQVSIGNAYIPLTFVLMNVVYTAGAYPLGKLSDRIGRFWLLLAGFTLYALIYLGFAFSGQAWQVWLLFALYGLYLALTQGNMLAIVGDEVPSDLRGTAFGFINLVNGIVLLPASLIAGLLWQHVSPAATFLAGSIFACLSVLFLFLTRAWGRLQFTALKDGV